VVHGEPIALAAWAGAALAFAYIVRPTNAIPLALGAAWVAWNHPRRLPGCLAAIAAVLGPWLMLNRHVYHAWLPPYYHASRFNGNPFFWDAFIGYIVSPGRGLLVYSPVLIFAVAGVALKIRRRQFTTLDLSLVACVLLHWIATSKVNAVWWGGDSYGPRFFTDMLPYLIYWMVPFIAWLETAVGRRRLAAGAIFAATLTVSVLMHAQGVFNPAAIAWSHDPAPIEMDPLRLWDWRRPPFLAGLQAPPSAPAATPIACATAPTVPAGFSIVSSERRAVVLSWQPSAGATGYAIEVGDSPGANNLPSRASSTTMLTVNRVPPGRYYARVRGTNACGLSGSSAEIEVTVR
jgi:hypothetical protein